MVQVSHDLFVYAVAIYSLTSGMYRSDTVYCIVSKKTVTMESLL